VPPRLRRASSSTLAFFDAEALETRRKTQRRNAFIILVFSACLRGFGRASSSTLTFFDAEHPRRVTSSFIAQGNLIRRPGAAHVSGRQAREACRTLHRRRKNTVRNQRVAMSFRRAQGNLIRRPGADVSRRQAGRPVAHCIDARKNTSAESTSCDEFPDFSFLCAPQPALRRKHLLLPSRHAHPGPRSEVGVSHAHEDEEPEYAA
jgi:hypothetical protein